MKKDIAVYGAYGHTGKFIVARLCEQGYYPVLIGRNKNKSFQRTPLNKRELNIALFLRDIYISNKALQSIHSCLHDTVDQ